MSLLTGLVLIAAAGVAGLLVGRKNPDLASAAAVLVALGEAKAQSMLAAAKAKLTVK